MEPAVVGTWSVIMASLMVSRLPTYSFKRLKVPQLYVLPFLVVVGLMLAGLAGRPWHVLTLFTVMYLMTFPFSYRSFRRLKAEADRLHEGGDDDDSGSDDQDQHHASPNLRSI